MTRAHHPRTMRQGRQPRPSGRLRRRYAAVALTVLVVISGLVLVATQDGYVATAVSLGTGSVWVTSEGPGQLALLDGASAAVTVRLKVADGGHDITAVQGRRAGYVVDRTAGTLIRADAATWRVTATAPIDGTTAGLAGAATDPALYLTDVERGLVVTLDPDTLQPMGGPQSLSATRGSGAPVADATGALWLLDAANGDLIRMVDTPHRSEGGFAGGTGSRLVLVQGAPAVVDLSNRSATAIDPRTGRRTGPAACVDTDPTDPTVTMAGSPTEPVVYLASGRDGILRITDLADGTCRAAVTISTPGTDLGEPVVMGGRVFVPDRTTGEVIIVDPRSHRLDRTVPVVPPNTSFELLGQDGFVYYNEPAGNLAGVVHTDGSVAPIVKYDPADPERDVHLDPNQPAESTPQVVAPPTTDPTLTPVETSLDTAQPTPAETSATASPTGPPAESPHSDSASTAPPSAGPVNPPPPDTTSSAPTVSISSVAPSSPSSPAGPAGPADQPSPSPDVLTASASGPPAAHAGDRVDLSVSVSGGTITRITWDFGDGASAETTTGATTHTWSASADQPYHVKVVVTVQDGRTAGADLPIQITDRPPATLTVDEPTGGSVVDGQLLTCPTVCTTGYPQGSTVQLSADPDTDKIFARWTGDCATEPTNVCHLTMSADRTVGAVFGDDPQAQTAVVTGVTFTGTWNDPTVTIAGRHFQPDPPASTSAAVTTCGEYGPGNGQWFDKKDLWFIDDTAAWEAGASDGQGAGDCVGIAVQQWSPTQIVFKFGVSYNSFDHWYITPGDSIRMIVRGTTYTGTVQLP